MPYTRTVHFEKKIQTILKKSYATFPMDHTVRGKRMSAVDIGLDWKQNLKIQLFYLKIQKKFSLKILLANSA